ncbi:hypothetical protein [Rickettsiales endosymbiont of Stachyamoeba lipophora]|uniref:hypothetical protein n=1 Tax=Rickettsiales endosymbiont of Stachyamoeba lipophora TaxID=2486578 RepID=UPI000F6477A7|nr:hypothetical protein [Rickettsiales endosymbiont of Stachyamoeba lipophora]AZL15050.1 hypothetical protein EF513_00510 [Rickettsiales endosymbiont of Stachyamoeba lipophora]
MDKKIKQLIDLGFSYNKLIKLKEAITANKSWAFSQMLTSADKIEKLIGLKFSPEQLIEVCEVNTAGLFTLLQTDRTAELIGAKFTPKQLIKITKTNSNVIYDLHHWIHQLRELLELGFTTEQILANINSLEYLCANIDKAKELIDTGMTPSDK